VTSQSPRQIAYSVLKRWAAGMGFAENLLRGAFEKNVLTYKDRAFCQELVFGVIRWQALLDWLIKQKVHEKTPPLRTRILIRMGLYQMIMMDRVPPYAAVNESVKLAKALGFKTPDVSFVNAVLRAFASDLENTEQLIARIQKEEPSVGYSHPAWLYRRWVARYGLEKTVKLMEWDNIPPPIFARVNNLKVDRDKLLERWDYEKVKWEPFTASWLTNVEFFRIEPSGNPEALGSFKDGWFYIQDPSTALAVMMLEPAPGERILDYCAAPGGKTTLMAQLMKNNGFIRAVEISKRGLRLLAENCTRLGITIVEAGDTPPAEGEMFDRVLIDVPCSNTGVLRRRVEVRWRLSDLELSRLVSTQNKLLEKATRHVKPGGLVVYSTCSLEPEENAGVVNAFLSRHPEFELETLRQLLPFEDRVDGAFVAALRRKAS